MFSTLRSLANLILGRTRKPGRVDTATRMAMDADFSAKGRTDSAPAPQEPPVDPLAELVRLINEDPKPKPEAPKAASRARRSNRRQES